MKKIVAATIVTILFSSQLSLPSQKEQLHKKYENLVTDLENIMNLELSRKEIKDHITKIKYQAHDITKALGHDYIIKSGLISKFHKALKKAEKVRNPLTEEETQQFKNLLEKLGVKCS